MKYCNDLNEKKVDYYFKDINCPWSLKYPICRNSKLRKRNDFFSKFVVKEHFCITQCLPKVDYHFFFVIEIESLTNRNLFKIHFLVLMIMIGRQGRCLSTVQCKNHRSRAFVESKHPQFLVSTVEHSTHWFWRAWQSRKHVTS